MPVANAGGDERMKGGGNTLSACAKKKPVRILEPNSCVLFETFGGACPTIVPMTHHQPAPWPWMEHTMTTVLLLLLLLLLLLQQASKVAATKSAQLSAGVAHDCRWAAALCP